MKKIPLKILLVLICVIILLVGNVLIYSNIAKKVTTGTPIVFSKIETPALLVIDVQESTTGEVASNESLINQSDSLITNINKLIRTCDTTNIPVIFITNEITNPLINFLDNSSARGSAGPEVDKRLTVGDHPHYYKRKLDAFSNSDFEDYLLEHKINTLYITGLDAKYCISSTVLGALNREYKVNLLTNVIISAEPTQCDSIFTSLSKNGAEIIPTLPF